MSRDPEALARSRARAVEAASNPRHRPLPVTLVTPVMGISFAKSYPANLQAIEAEVAVAWWRRGEEETIVCLLVREPDNEHDPNSVAIVTESGIELGHVPRAIALRLAPEIDAGTRWVAELAGFRVSRQHPDRPGVDVRLTRE